MNTGESKNTLVEEALKAFDGCLSIQISFKEAEQGEMKSQTCLILTYLILSYFKVIKTDWSAT